MGGRRQGRDLKEMPAAKLFIGAAMLTLLAVAVHMFFSFDLHVPAVVFWCAVLLGVLVRCIPAKARAKPLGKLPFLGAFIVACGFGLGLPLLSTQGYIAEVYARQGASLNDQMLERAKELQVNSAFIQKRIEVLQAAVDNNPDHGDARSMLSLALADRSYIKPTERIDIGQQAEQHARGALDLNQTVPGYWVKLGDSLNLQERREESGKAYQQATKLGPNNAIVWYSYAQWLRDAPGRRTDALAAIDKSISLDPSNVNAHSMRRMILIP